MNVKQVLIVRRDLNMSPGKIAAQCVHAGQRFLMTGLDTEPEDFQEWKATGETIVVLGCGSSLELLDLWAQAKESNLAAHVMVDEGRTEVAPNTNTCLAIGPACSDRIDPITRHLRLL